MDLAADHACGYELPTAHPEDAFPMIRPSNYFIPTVTEMTHRGETRHDIWSRLLVDRIVFLGTQVDDNVANVIVAQLLRRRLLRPRTSCCCSRLLRRCCRPRPRAPQQLLRLPRARPA